VERQRRALERRDENLISLEKIEDVHEDREQLAIAKEQAA